MLSCLRLVVHYYYFNLCICMCTWVKYVYHIPREVRKRYWMLIVWVLVTEPQFLQDHQVLSTTESSIQPWDLSFPLYVLDWLLTIYVNHPEVSSHFHQQTLEIFIQWFTYFSIFESVARELWSLEKSCSSPLMFLVFLSCQL